MPRTILVTLTALALVVAFFMLLPQPESPQPDAWPAQGGNSFVMRGVRVFDGERVRERVDVLVEGGMVTAVNPRVPVPAGVPEFAAAGHTLLPAFIDAHTHNFMGARADALRFGVGTQVDMFTNLQEFDAARVQRVALERVDTADMWSAGTLVTAPGGHGTQFGGAIPTLEKPADAAPHIAARAAEGSDFIKLVLESGDAWKGNIPTLDRATLAAAIDAAHAHGLLAVVHAGTQREAETAVATGADALVHLFGDTIIEPELVTVLREQDIFVIPTLTVLESVSGRTSGLHDDPAISPYLSPVQMDGVRQAFPGGERRADFIERARESTRALHAAGVTILAGSDAPNPGTAHGASLHRELELLVDAGLSPMDALVAATSAVADRFAIPERGRISAGQRADFVLVAGDPLAAITATRDIAAIWKNGYRVERARFDSSADAVPPIEDPVLGSFDSGTDGWMPTTDTIQGGASEVALSHSNGALAVTAEVRSGAPWPWAGAMRMLGEGPMEPVDITAFDEVVIRMRASGPVNVLFFSGAASQRAPRFHVVAPSDGWREVTVPFAAVQGFDPSSARAIAVVAGPTPGPARIEVDSVVLR